MKLPDIARDATYYKAPDGLREKVLGSLAEVRVAEPARERPWGWVSLAMAAAVIGFIGGSWQMRADAVDPLAHEVLDAHVRSLMAGARLNDVISTDQHTVKPWFAGKLDFAPPVRDPSGLGFALMGGRLDYVGGRPVAALTYQRRLHVINLFVWPAKERAADEPAQAANLNGYSLVHWTRAGMRHWAISDINPSELDAFAEAIAASQ